MGSLEPTNPRPLLAAESFITQQKPAGSDHGVGWGQGRGECHVVDGIKQKKAALKHMLEADNTNYKQKLPENTT